MAKKHKHSECGDTVCFHGAFSTRAKAEAKAKARKGSVISRRIQGSTRYVVITGKK